MTAIVPKEAREIGWRERWLGWRNRIIATPAFQRWAAESIFTKFVARRRARALFDICAGFVYSQVLLACVRLRVFDMLARGPLPLEVLVARFDMSRDSAERLLKAAVALQLLRTLPGDRYALGDLGASMLGNPSIADFVEHHTILYQDLSDPLALLRGQKETQLSKFWPYAEDRPGSSKPPASSNSPELKAYADYSALMASSQALIADDILAAYPLGKHKRLLDVGGGEGAFIEAAARANPNLEFELFDLPPVAEQARLRFSGLSLDKRVDVTGGSFLHDPLPTGADVISFIRIIHDHDDESVRIMLRAAYAALKPGGVLLLAEPMAEAPGAEPVGDAYFGFYLLAMGRGRPRSAGELARLMESAGFTAVGSRPTRRPLLTSLITGYRV
jgi:demethylspheroidene O-methyltransferase